jgi:glutathione S-transferase
MSLKLYHHPQTRAAQVVWMLEELIDLERLPGGYDLIHVDLQKGEHLKGAVKEHNKMSKLPVLVDGDVTVVESAAIAMYLADKYAPGQLAPALEAPARAAYLRWCVYPAAVIEPCCMATSAKWPFTPGRVGWGDMDRVIATLEQEALARGPYLLGEQFTMADVLMGVTLRWMVSFKMMEPRQAVTDYIARLEERPALKRADEKNNAIIAAHAKES